MNRLVALFNQGFMKLTGGKRVRILTDEEVILTKEELDEMLDKWEENVILKQEVEKLQEMSQKAHGSGYRKGLEDSSKYTLLLPVSIREENRYLVDVVSLIAGELLEQGDLDSCKWLFQKFHQCRSL